METNPVERNVVTRFILGFAVIFGMMLGAAVGAGLLGVLGLGNLRVLGVAGGALAVFLGFAVWYTRYDASFGTD